MSKLTNNGLILNRYFVLIPYEASTLCRINTSISMNVFVLKAIREKKG
jgi:hypothetical protein